MNDATATEKSSAPAETTSPESSSTETTAPASTTPGLLADATPGAETQPPATETPSPETTPEPGAIVQRPDNIPEQFWNKEEGKPNAEALANSYNDLRKQNNKLLADRGKGAPETAEEYLKDYQPPLRARTGGDGKEGHTLERFGELKADDPVFVAMSKFAKNGNMSPAAFTDGMQELMETLHPLLPETFDPEKEKALLGEGSDHMINTNREWIDTLMRNGVVNEDEYSLLLGFGGTALGVQLTNKLRLNSGERPIPGKLNGDANKGRKTPDECQAMMADERYTQDGPAGDAYRTEVEKAFAETYGTAKA